MSKKWQISRAMGGDPCVVLEWPSVTTDSMDYVDISIDGIEGRFALGGQEVSDLVDCLRAASRLIGNPKGGNRQ